MLVEAAFVAPLFFLLIFGVLEFGLAFKTSLTVSNTSGNAARTASAAGNDALADFAILQEVARASGAIDPDDIQYIVVFDAGSATGTIDVSPLSACKSASVTGLCNRYTPADFGRPETDFGCSTTTPSPDRFFCPTSRDVALSDPPDYVGVYVVTRYEYFTGMFGDGRTFAEETIYRIEPRES